MDSTGCVLRGSEGVDGVRECTMNNLPFIISNFAVSKLGSQSPTTDIGHVQAHILTKNRSSLIDMKILRASGPKFLELY